MTRTRYSFLQTGHRAVCCLHIYRETVELGGLPSSFHPAAGKEKERVDDGDAGSIRGWPDGEGGCRYLGMALFYCSHGSILHFFAGKVFGLPRIGC